MVLRRGVQGEVNLCGLPPGQHSSEETSRWWRAVGNPLSDLTGPAIEAQICGIDGDVTNIWANRPVSMNLKRINMIVSYSCKDYSSQFSISNLPTDGHFEVTATTLSNLEMSSTVMVPAIALYHSGVGAVVSPESFYVSPSYVCFLFFLTLF